MFAAVDGVAEADGSVDSESTTLIDRDNDAIVFGGAPNLGFSISQRRLAVQPARARRRRPGPGPNEVVIDEGTADKKDFAIGDTIGVQAEGPVERLRISGIVRFDSDISIGGATLAGFDLPTAQRLFEKEGKLDEIPVAAEPASTDAQLSPTSATSCRRTRRCGRARSRPRRTPPTRTSSSPSSRAFCSRSPGSRSSSAAS